MKIIQMILKLYRKICTGIWVLRRIIRIGIYFYDFSDLLSTLIGLKVWINLNSILVYVFSLLKSIICLAPLVVIFYGLFWLSVIICGWLLVTNFGFRLNWAYYLSLMISLRSLRVFLTLFFGTKSSFLITHKSNSSSMSYISWSSH